MCAPVDRRPQSGPFISAHAILQASLSPRTMSLGVLTIGTAPPHVGRTAPSIAVEVQRIEITVHALCMQSKARLRTVRFESDSGRRAARARGGSDKGQRQWRPTIGPRSRLCQAPGAHERSTVVHDNNSESSASCLDVNGICKRRFSRRCLCKTSPVCGTRMGR